VGLDCGHRCRGVWAVSHVWVALRDCEGAVDSRSAQRCGIGDRGRIGWDRGRVLHWTVSGVERNNVRCDLSCGSVDRGSVDSGGCVRLAGSGSRVLYGLN